MQDFVLYLSMPNSKKAKPLEKLNVTPKKFDSKKFEEAASEVYEILKEEQQQDLKEKLESINENYYTFKLL